MKPDYKNWVPRGLLFLLGGMAIICLALCIVFGMAGVATEGGLRIALGVLFGAAFLLVAVLTGIFANMYCAFSYNGKRKISKRVIEGIAKYVTLPDGGRGLDVGCGSGAVEPIFAVIGYFLAANLTAAQLWFLAFAAGAMIFVVVEDLIPDAHLSEHPHFGTWGAMLGFAVMMALDVALG